MAKNKNKSDCCWKFDPMVSDKTTNRAASEFDTELIRREAYFSALTRDIVYNNRESQRLKNRFFWIVCIAFLIVCCGSIAAIVVVAAKGETSYADLGIAVSALVGLVGAIIALPTIIAKHLFPENSEKNRFDFIRDVQRSDMGSTSSVVDNTDDQAIDDDVD